MRTGEQEGVKNPDNFADVAQLYLRGMRSGRPHYGDCGIATVGRYQNLERRGFTKELQTEKNWSDGTFSE